MVAVGMTAGRGDRAAGDCQTADVSHLWWLAHQGKAVAVSHRPWMAWNLELAFLPLALGALLFRHPGRRSPLWWVLAAGFALLLPNAPYVVSDLVHLRGDIAAAPTLGVVVTSILPLYAAFVALGYISYLACIELVIREVRTVWPGSRRWVITTAVHGGCSIGIVLGRLARLNSWDTITSPTSTLDRAFSTLAWSGAPVAFVLVFVAVATTAAVLRAVLVGLWRWAQAATLLRGSTSRPAI